MSVLSERIDRLALPAGEYRLNRVALTLEGPDGVLLILNRPPMQRKLALLFRRGEATVQDLLATDPDDRQGDSHQVNARRRARVEALERLRVRLGPEAPLTIDGDHYRWRGAGQRPLPEEVETLCHGVEVDFDRRTVGSQPLQPRANVFRLLAVALLTSYDVTPRDVVALAWPGGNLPKAEPRESVPGVNACLERLGVPERLSFDRSGNLTHDVSARLLGTN